MQESGKSIKHVPEHLKTAELCLMAIQQDGNMLQYVPEKLRTRELCEMGIQSGGAQPALPKILFGYMAG